MQCLHFVGPDVAVSSASAEARIDFLSSFVFSFRLASLSLRETRCFSAQVSHLVWLGIAGSPQCRHCPESLALSSFSLCLIRCLSRLASGVRGAFFGTGSFGGVLFLVLFALGAGFCFFFPPRLGSWKVSVKSCGFA